LTLTVEAHGSFNHVSVTVMLIPTNDGFFAVNGELGPIGSERTVTYYSPAYDADTQANESYVCTFPGRQLSAAEKASIRAVREM
jgi:hypothetical protein